MLNEIFYKYLINKGVDEDHIIRFSFDSIDSLRLINKGFIDLEREKRGVNPEKFIDFVNSKILDNQNYYLLLYEIQLMDCFEAVLNGYLRKQNIDINVTGSSAKFLPKDIISEFAGKGDEIRIQPLNL